jgi:hypothetical protein
MLSASDIDRYHFRMTDNHDGGTFDYDVDFESDLVIIESDVPDHLRLTAILGKAQREDLLQSINRFRVTEVRSSTDPGTVVGRLDVVARGRPSHRIISLKDNRTMAEFALYMVSLAQYMGLSDRHVEYWAKVIRREHILDK